jgi:molecular chaperone GrpE
MRKEFKIIEKPISARPLDIVPNIGEGVAALIKNGAKMTSNLEKETENTEKVRKELFIDMLEIADSLEHILLQIGELPKQETTEKIAGHVHTTTQQLTWLLRRRGVFTFDTVGKLADPALTEIIGEEERTDCIDEEVIRETAKGYMYKGKLLRRARVIVARKKEA